MELNEVYEILNEIHNNQDVVNFEALIKFITRCDKIKILDSYIHYGEDIYKQHVYEVEIKIDNTRCNLWVYFYDADNVTIQQVFSFNERVKSINYTNQERMRLDFKPIRVDERKIHNILSKYW